MLCKYCGEEMVIDDVDFNFRGNKNIYWLCCECDASAFEKIRYNRSIKVEWEKGSVENGK